MPVCIACEGDIPEQFSYNEENENWDFDKPAEEYDGDYDDSFMEEFGGSGDYDDDDRQDRDGDEYYRDERYESLDDYIDRL